MKGKQYLPCHTTILKKVKDVLKKAVKIKNMKGRDLNNREIFKELSENLYAKKGLGHLNKVDQISESIIIKTGHAKESLKKLTLEYNLTWEECTQKQNLYLFYK